MNNNASSAEPRLKVVARPSLYTNDVVPTGGKSGSILGSLDTDRPARKPSRRAVMTGTVALLLIGLFYWANASSLFSKPFALPEWAEAALNISKPTRAAPPQATQQIVTKVEQPVVAPVPVEETRPAVIVTEQPPATMPDVSIAKSEPADKLVKLDSDQTRKKDGNEQLKPLADAVKQTSATKSVAVATVQPLVHTPVQTAKQEVAQKANQKPVEVAASAKPVKQEAAKTTKDGDVDLIAALIARVTPPDTNVKDSKPGVTVTPPAKQPASQPKHKSTDPGRDVIAKTNEESTENLVKRCKTLGFFEGELCRVRICSKLWGVDPACPAAD
jgi:hypothetical protein